MRMYMKINYKNWITRTCDGNIIIDIINIDRKERLRNK